MRIEDRVCTESEGVQTIITSANAKTSVPVKSVASDLSGGACFEHFEKDMLHVCKGDVFRISKLSAGDDHEKQKNTES